MRKYDVSNFINSSSCHVECYYPLNTCIVSVESERGSRSLYLLTYFIAVTIPLVQHGELTSRARCIPLKHLLSSTRGVKDCPNSNIKSTETNLLLKTSVLQEKEKIVNQTCSNFKVNNYNLNQDHQLGNTMFYEFSNKKKMECERYQDCSWFQQDFLKESSKSKLSLGEKEESNFSLNDFDLEMQYANDHTIPQVEDYLEVFDDVFLDGNGKNLDVNKFSWKSGDEKITFPNDNLICDSNNAFCGLKKTDSFDNIEYISSNPADIVPITLMECMNNSGSGIMGIIKKEVKEETESYLPESDSMIQSDDSDLNIGREEIIEEENSNDVSDLACKATITDVKVDKLDSPNVTNAVNVKASNGNKEKYLKKNSSYATDNYKENKNMLTPNIKNENINVNCVLGEKLDLNLDLPKVNFEQSINVNTPDLDFMDLVDFINEDMKMNCKENNPLSMPETCPNYNNLSLNQNKSESNLLKDQISTDSNTLKDQKNSLIHNDVPEEYSSIAERIKAKAKRRVPKNYNVTEEDGSDKDDSEYEYDNDCETNESDSDDYNTNESESKRKCNGINKKSKTEDSKNNSEGIKDGSKSIDSYRERRDKNNEASRRSRQNRKNRERHMFKTLEEEERRNVKLRAEADVLEKQVTSLRQLLLQVVLRKADGT